MISAILQGRCLLATFAQQQRSWQSLKTILAIPAAQHEQLRFNQQISPRSKEILLFKIAILLFKTSSISQNERYTINESLLNNLLIISLKKTKSSWSRIRPKCGMSDEWVNEWVNAWVSEWWGREWGSEWVSGFTPQHRAQLHLLSGVLIIGLVHAWLYVPACTSPII